ncbi:MAG: hypothetical protein AB7V77_05860 [Candidatus Woesearchaeota archaeon]
MIEERCLYGVIEVKGDNIMFNLKDGFDTFEEAVKFRESSSMFRDKSKLIIIQRVEIKNDNN